MVGGGVVLIKMYGCMQKKLEQNVPSPKKLLRMEEVRKKDFKRRKLKKYSIHENPGHPPPPPR